MPTNREIARILNVFSEFLEMEEVSFKPRAYQKAAEMIDGFGAEVEALYKSGGLRALENIPSVGKGIATKIEEYIATGKIREYEALRKKIPVEMDELRSIEGVGPKMVKTLYQKLGVRDIKTLKKAAAGGKIRALPRFGAKLEEKILKGISFYEKSHGRFSIGDALPLARSVVARIHRVKGVGRVEIAGSLRRWQETIGDIDLLVLADESKQVMDFFVAMPEVVHVYSKGDTKSSVRISGSPRGEAGGIDVDLRVIPKESYGAALQYFTGSKDHNVMLRTLAGKKSMKLNEYGLYKGKRLVAGGTEESIYKALGVPMPIPELRQGTDELEKIYKDIVETRDLRGDLQTQTDWTDGKNSILEMARATQKLGHEYIAITDHTRSLAMTGGADEKKLRRQMKEIDHINMMLRGVTILKGAEVNIMKNGSLDINDETLATLDVVGASVHSHFTLSREDQTARIKRAMSSPHVDIIFHPTGRLVGKREPYAVDMEELVKHAKKTKTVMEINAHPMRLDLKDEHIRMGMKEKNIFAVDTDAHAVAELSLLEYGIGQARRAGLPKKYVLNTLSLRALKAFLKRPKHKRNSP